MKALYGVIIGCSLGLIGLMVMQARDNRAKERSELERCRADVADELNRVERAMNTTKEAQVIARQCMDTLHALRPSGAP